MWSNFFVQQDEEGHIGIAGTGQAGGLGGMKVGRGHRRTHKMSDSLEGKIKLAFFLSIIGVTLSVLGMGTEFWAELAQPKSFSGNQTCQMAHYGLWKGCIRTLWVADIDPERTSCGPAELPGGEISRLHVSVSLHLPLCVLFSVAGEVSALSPHPTPNCPLTSASPLTKPLGWVSLWTACTLQRHGKERI